MTTTQTTATADAIVELLDDTSDRAMQRCADACIEMLSGMVQARIDLGMTDDDEIADSIRESLIRMMRAAK